MPPKKNAVAARIKRLMQADDDVGKIAQATPVLMAKALDLFLEELMKSTTEIASSHGAKTVSAGHLRASIMRNEKFDFLKDIVEGVPDLPTEQGMNMVVGSLDEGEEEVRVAAGRAGGAGASTAKRERPQMPTKAKAAAVEGDDEPAPKAMKSGAAATGSLEEEEGVVGLGSSIAPRAPTFGTAVGNLEEDDDYDDL